MPRLATAALVAMALLAPGCTGATDETSPATVDEIRAAFEGRDIRLTEFVTPATKNSLLTVLAPHDSEQFTVSVFRTTEQARQLFQVAAGQEPQFEVVKGSCYSRRATSTSFSTRLAPTTNSTPCEVPCGTYRRCRST